jgi:protein-L-isoaspartate O-methyltransferase
VASLCASGDAHLEAHLDRLITEVTALLGGPVPPAYEAAVRAVPRHVFLPDQLWLRDGEGGYRPCERAADPEGWMTAAYSDAPLVTQFTDGLPSSSASMVSMVLRTLLLVELTPHRKGPVQRVLELGTGTGFSTALLCALCGDQAVTTLELDPRLAARGDENLKSAGYTPTVVCTDASGGWAPRGPYDRIVATFSVDHIPTAWLRQLSPGGRIVTPWTSAWCGYGTATLTGRQDGGAVHQFGDQPRFADAGDPGDGGDVGGAARSAPGFEGVELGCHAGQRYDGGLGFEQVGGGQLGVGDVVEQESQVGGLQLGGHAGHGGDSVGEPGGGEQAGGGHQVEQAAVPEVGGEGGHAHEPLVAEGSGAGHALP